MLLRGSQIILECLKEQKVDTIFGYPGGQVLEIYNALYDYKDSIRHILTAMSRARRTRRTDMPGRRAKSASVSRRQDPEQQIGRAHV